jgi:hypothetical protein
VHHVVHLTRSIKSSGDIAATRSSYGVFNALEFYHAKIAPLPVHIEHEAMWGLTTSHVV